MSNSENASYLQAGSNLVAAVVWNDGRAKPEAQISYLTGFSVQGNTAAEEILNTDDSWKTAKDDSYHPYRCACRVITWPVLQNW